MNNFSKWYERQTKDKGNDKRYRNKKGMELAWNAAAVEQQEACRKAVWDMGMLNEGMPSMYILKMNKQLLVEKLRDAFIKYQYRLDNPYPQPSETFKGMVEMYRSDYVFNAKVDSVVAGVLGIIDEVEKLDDK